MPTIKRTDGAQFAIQTYRELLTSQKPSALKNEITTLAENHGEYVHLSRHNKNIEAVFSRDPGYLLGETVWEYFNKPEDLVYCEALPEGQSAIVVVIKSGTVYLDTRIPFNSISDEFTSLITGTNQYDIYIYGDVPVSDVPEFGKFVFDPAFVHSFTRLNQGAFQKLPTDETLLLKPLDEALRSFQRRPISTRSIIYLVILVILLGIWWYVTRPAKMAVVPQLLPSAAPVNPYLAMENELTTSAPEQQLAQTTAITEELYLLPGWTPNSIKFQNNLYTIDVVSLGGDLANLEQWAESRHIPLTFTSTGATLTIASSIPARPTPQTYYDFQNMVVLIVDRINHIIPDAKIQIGTTNPIGPGKEVSLIIPISQASPSLLSLIGSQIAGLPVILTLINLSFVDGLLTGTIQMKILGK